MEQITIHTDGGARGNPGPAGYAFILSRPGQPDLEENGFLGEATNNVAEYTAVVKALQRAKELGGRRVLIKSDSELMVKQMKGQYKVKNAGLLPLYNQARQLSQSFDEVAFQHVRREYNKEADQLCNDAMDFRRSTVGGPAVAPSPLKLHSAPFDAEEATSENENKGKAKTAAEVSVLAEKKWKKAKEEGLARLEDVLEDEGNPSAEELWKEMLAILKKHGLLKGLKKPVL